MTTAGQKLIAGRVPGERIAKTTVVSDSANITTTETTVASVTAALVTGRTYKISFHAAVDTSVAGDAADARIREDNSTGTEMQLRRTYLFDNTGRWPVNLWTEYTAVSSGNKTFVGTIVRVSGTGNIILKASATIPTLLTVDYVEG